MKNIIILSLFTGLFSCSGYYHIKQAKKHTQKAVNKGVTVSKDTTVLTKSDTTVLFDTLNNVITRTVIIRDSVYLEGKTVYIAKSRTEARQEQKTERTKVRQEEKTERKAVKVEAKTERKKVAKQNWKFYLGVIVGFILCFFILKFDSIVALIKKL